MDPCRGRLRGPGAVRAARLLAEPPGAGSGRCASAFVVVSTLVLGVLANRWVLRPLLDYRHAFVVDAVRQRVPERHHVAAAPAAASPPGRCTSRRASSPGCGWIDRSVRARSTRSRSRRDRIARESWSSPSGTPVTSPASLSRLVVGRRVYVDGPYGSFTPDLLGRRGLLLVAGGVGITPMMSILRTLAHRRDRRAHRLVVGVRSDADLMFADELDRPAAPACDSRSSKWSATRDRAGPAGPAEWTNGCSASCCLDERADSRSRSSSAGPLRMVSGVLDGAVRHSAFRTGGCIPSSSTWSDHHKRRLKELSVNPDHDGSSSPDGTQHQPAIPAPRSGLGTVPCCGDRRVAGRGPPSRDPAHPGAAGRSCPRRGNDAPCHSATGRSAASCGGARRAAIWPGQSPGERSGGSHDGKARDPTPGSFHGGH